MKTSNTLSTSVVIVSESTGSSGIRKRGSAMRPSVGLAGAALHAPVGTLREQRAHFVGRQRSGIEVPLRQLAPQLAQQAVLGVGFYAFAGHAQIERAGQG